MAKVAFGIMAGVLLTAGVLIAGRHFLSMTIPFTEESLSLGSHSHIKPFVQDLREFHPGSFDTDAYEIWFRFSTHVLTAAEYFGQVDEAIRGSDWKLLDRHGGFSLYASEWQKAFPSALRLEITLHFDPQTQTVIFEERRRYE